MRSTILTQKRAKTLRRNLTQPEQALWALLRRNNLGLHFRRQHALGPFILDFYCSSANLCVEVDGVAHEEGYAARPMAREPGHSDSSIHRQGTGATARGGPRHHPA